MVNIDELTRGEEVRDKTWNDPSDSITIDDCSYNPLNKTLTIVDKNDRIVVIKKDNLEICLPF